MALQRLEAGVGARWRLASPRGRGGAWSLAARRELAAPCLEAGMATSGAWRVPAKPSGLDLRTAKACRVDGRANTSSPSCRKVNFSPIVDSHFL